MKNLNMLLIGLVVLFLVYLIMEGNTQREGAYIGFYEIEDNNAGRVFCNPKCLRCNNEMSLGGYDSTKCTCNYACNQMA